MKKVILLLVLFVFFCSDTAFSKTYSCIPYLNGNMEFNDNYVSKQELKTVFDNLFLKETEFIKDETGHATGYDFFALIKELGFYEYNVPNSEIYYSRALTPESLYELLEYYFPYIADSFGIKSHFGKLSKSHTGYLVTYAKGITYEFENFDFFKVKDELTDVWVITKDENIIGVFPHIEDISFSSFVNKKEIEGDIYLLYDGGLIIDTGEDLLEFPVTEDFKILNKKGNKVVLILGDYKYTNQTAVLAVGKDD